MRKAVVSICPQYALKPVLIEGIKRVVFEHRPAIYSNDDEYWLAQSPFNGKWYVFVANDFVQMPERPVFVEDTRPIWFDD